MADEQTPETPEAETDSRFGIPPLASNGVVVADDTRALVTTVFDSLAGLIAQDPSVVGGRRILTQDTVTDQMEELPEGVQIGEELWLPTTEGWEPADEEFFLPPGDGRLTAPGGDAGVGPGGKREASPEDWDRAARALIAAGFSGEALVTALAVGATESIGFTDFEGDTHLMDSTWGPSLSPWQIRSAKAQTGTGGERDAEALVADPWKQGAESAYVISNGGKNFGPWTVYRKGTYRENLAKAKAIVQKFQATKARGGAALETLRTTR